MFRFLTKTVLLSTLALGASVVLFGKDQIVKWAHDGKSAVEQEISEHRGLPAELRRVESKVDDLDREIRKLKEHVIKEDIEIRNLDNEVNRREAGLEELHHQLDKARELLGRDGDRFKIGHSVYTREEIETDVASKIELYRVEEETLGHMKLTLRAHRDAYQLAQENVGQSEAVKRELLGKVELMKAELQKYKARQVYAEAVAMDFDAEDFNTEIGKVRQDLAKFAQRLEVQNRLLDERMRVAVDGKVAGIDYDAPERPAYDLYKELNELLTGVPATSEAVATTVVIDQE